MPNTAEMSESHPRRHTTFWEKGTKNLLPQAEHSVYYCIVEKFNFDKRERRSSMQLLVGG